MLNSTLEINVSKDLNPNYWKVDFSGNLDSYSLKDKRKEIMDLVAALDRPMMVFDLEKLVFINSESISLLMNISETLAAAGKKLVLVSAKKNVFDVLDVIGAFEVVTHYKAYEDFLKTLENAK